MEICQHIKANGIRCGSPAMQHAAFCFFHTDVRLRRRHKRMPLPILEDANSVQLALNQIATRILDESMDLKRSGQLLYMLQISSQNIANTRFEQVVDSLKRAIVREYTPALEAELQPLFVRTPAAEADIAEMHRHQAEWVREQGAAKKGAETVKPNDHSIEKADPSLRSG